MLMFTIRHFPEKLGPTADQPPVSASPVLALQAHATGTCLCDEKEQPRDCRRTAHLLEGGRGQLYPRKNGQLDSCGSMSLAGVRALRVLHLHTQEQQGSGE